MNSEILKIQYALSRREFYSVFGTVSTCTSTDEE